MQAGRRAGTAQSAWGWCSARHTSQPHAVTQPGYFGLFWAMRVTLAVLVSRQRLRLSIDNTTRRLTTCPPSPSRRQLRRASPGLVLSADISCFVLFFDRSVHFVLWFRITRGPQRSSSTHLTHDRPRLPPQPRTCAKQALTLHGHKWWLRISGPARAQAPNPEAVRYLMSGMRSSHCLRAAYQVLDLQNVPQNTRRRYLMSSVFSLCCLLSAGATPS